MVEMNQFGSVPPGSAQVCGRCEALLMDVLDGTASGEDQTFFDGHVASCTGCSQMLEDVRRGGAWLELLRDPRPEPQAALFARILAQTSGLVVSDLAGASVVGSAGMREAVAVYSGSGVGGGYTPVGPGTAQQGSFLKVLPFRVRGALHSVGQTMLQPRLAMTAAMAFFSIALTLNLTGVHVGELRMSDLRPSNLRRDFYAANAHVVRYCDNLRVVYELEARAHDLQRSSDNNSGPSTPNEEVPASPKDPGSVDQPGDKPDAPKGSPKPGPGTSREEPLTRDNRLVAEERGAGIRFGSAPTDRSSLALMHLKGDPA